MGATLGIDAPPRHFPVQFDQRAVALGAPLRHAKRFLFAGSRLRYRTHHFRDDVAGLFDHHLIADADVFFTD